MRAPARHAQGAAVCGICTACVRSVGAGIVHYVLFSTCEHECGVDRVKGCGPCAHSRVRFVKAWDPLGRSPCAWTHFTSCGRCSPLQAVAGLRPLCRPAFGSRLPRGSGPALSLPSWVRGLGRLAKLTRAISDLPALGPHCALRCWAPPCNLARSLSLLRLPQPGGSGRRRVRPGGAVPYFTRCRAGVRRSSDK